MTTSARSAIKSVILPLPSSPHWAPTTTSPGMSEPVVRVGWWDVRVAVHRAGAERAAPSAAKRTAAKWTASSEGAAAAGGLPTAADRACARTGELALAVHVGELRIARQE